jgi:hypothetical protein
MRKLLAAVLKYALCLDFVAPGTTHAEITLFLLSTRSEPVEDLVDDHTPFGLKQPISLPIYASAEKTRFLA